MPPMPSLPAATPTTRNPSATGTPSFADARLSDTASVSSKPKPARINAEVNGSGIQKSSGIADLLHYPTSTHTSPSPLTSPTHTPHSPPPSVPADHRANGGDPRRRSDEQAFRIGAVRDHAGVDRRLVVVI